MKPRQSVVLDIETGPLCDKSLADIMPEFKAPANLRDPAKIAAAIEDKKAAYIESAALNAHTGMVLCVGIRDEIGSIMHLGSNPHDTERSVIDVVWQIVRETLSQNHWLVGWNITGFDLPFLMRRSWILGVQVPPFIRNHDRRFWQDGICDLMLVWSCGEREQRISLDAAARACGFGGKLGHGADFARLFHEDKPKALEYLTRDLELTHSLWERMLNGYSQP